MKTRLLTLCLIVIIAVCFTAVARNCRAGDNPTDAKTVNGAKTAEDPYAELKAAKSAEALMRLAEGYTTNKEVKKAVKAYERLIEDFPSSPIKLTARFRLALLHYKEGNLKEAESILKDITQAGEGSNTLKSMAGALLTETSNVLERVRGDLGGETSAIGVIVPLKGGYAQYGEAALRGALLAAGVFAPGAQVTPANVRVYVKDSGSNPKDTAAAVKGLAEISDVSGLVGPLLSATAFEAAAAAQESAIPIITLSQKEGVTGAGDYVFRNSLTPHSQALAAARYAITKLGKKNFAILTPQNSYGAALSEHFSKEVNRLGASVVSEVSYEEGTTDFTAEIKKIFGISVKKRREGRRTIKEYTQSAKIDALYIPEHYETVGIILPFIEYLGVKNVLLIGSNGWNSPLLASSAGKVMEGAVFTDGFFAGSARPGSMQFSERFRAAYGAEPGVIEAQAYDAALALISLITPPPAPPAPAKTTDEKTTQKTGDGPLPRLEFKKPDRAELKNMLRQSKPFTSASGEVSFGPDGEAVKKIFILTVKDGIITEAEDASL